MESKTVKLEELKQMAQRYDCALVYSLSKVSLSSGAEAELGEMTEAFFFDTDSEMHATKVEDGYVAVTVSDADFDEWLDTDYAAEPAFGKAITIRKYIAYDEDGQAYIAYTRLVEKKEAAV